MRVLFSHQNFPGQFGGFARYLSRMGHDVTFVTAAEVKASPGIRIVKMAPHREKTQGVHRFAANLEKAMINAQAFANACIAARKTGLEPDVVIAHSGWGSGTFAKAIWPDCTYISYVEWYYRWPPVDQMRASPGKSAEDGRAFALARNAPTLLDLTEADMVFCPSEFQAAQFPRKHRDNLFVLHDGVDTDALVPDPGAKMPTKDTPIPDDAEIVTYATRGLEPQRGFPEFMRALEKLQKRRPRLHAVIGGEDRVAYGAKLPPGESWKTRMLEELDLDLSRVHFVGRQSRADFTRLLQATDVHVYLTVPFVLSWSFIEAMSVGCALVASDVEPVREAVADRDSALLVDHTRIDDLANTIERLFEDRDLASALGKRARGTALQKYAARWIHPARASAVELAHRRRRADGRGGGT